MRLSRRQLRTLISEAVLSQNDLKGLASDLEISLNQLEEMHDDFLVLDRPEGLQDVIADIWKVKDTLETLAKYEGMDPQMPTGLSPYPGDD